MNSYIKLFFSICIIFGYIFLIVKFNVLKDENKSLATKSISLHSRFYEHDEKASLLNLVESYTSIIKYKNIL
ncbi:MAG: hypothetical protein K9J12_16405 [Melioribacteraceae bacterium]|nr:hypothetical protein [Melioribacteraceae bacterium]MCF8264919.1 hypothetical protein [Melioribacteraceae bacterium]MCF8430722.1 hypothetical protein [Melioribacteraceae bacterium]